MGQKKKVIDMIGFEFNGCVVIKRGGNSKDNRAKWICKCYCGNTFESTGKDIRNHKIKSCGCRKKNVNYKHGNSYKRLYNIWRGIISRCYNNKDTSYKNYGFRGVSVCDSWLNNFDSFEKWSLDNGYKDGLTIDRINVNGNYEPKNCRWATTKEQGLNKRNTVYANYNGKELPLSEIANITGIKYSTLHKRYKKGKDLYKTGNYKIQVLYDNNWHTIRELSEKFNVSRGVIKNRIKYGTPLEWKPTEDTKTYKGKKVEYNVRKIKD